MSAKVIFYALSQKFLGSKEKVPEQAQQVMYYSLAIGDRLPETGADLPARRLSGMDNPVTCW